MHEKLKQDKAKKKNTTKREQNWQLRVGWHMWKELGMAVNMLKTYLMKFKNKQTVIMK